MAKISLRAYTREIESLIERGQTEEAIAHCKYILRQFPKYIDAYRLLGKTYLESQRYSEAADILQRVLSSIPDDFVSQLGMSIIREDEGNLDAAIWHMERAFEVQPSNTAVQDELRRLYGRRDGVEPPKVRLTRGALVRMYARGELFPQAIAEARAAIAEDPQRIDLEIILARMYYLSGQKVEATEVCSRLVSKLSYCYEANRILAEILPTTSRAEDARTFQQNVNALDPYAAFLSPAAVTGDQVPENAVQLERMDWTPSAEGDQPPQWTRTAGVDYTAESSNLPDWLDSLPASSTTTAPAEKSAPPFQFPHETSSVIPPAEAANIPDWMRDAGWTDSSGQVQEEAPSVFDLAGEEDDLSPAELPAWLRDMAPAEETADLSPEEQDRLDLLDSILPPPVSEAEVSPLVETGDISPEAEITADAPAIPASEEELPEWLSSIETGEESITPAVSSQEELPAWLEEEFTSGAFIESSALAEEDLPEWLRTDTDVEDGTLSEVPTAETTGISSSSLDDTDLEEGMAWLESLAARQGADEETLTTSPEERRETPPEWVMNEIAEQQDGLIPGPFDTETVETALGEAELPTSEAAFEAESPISAALTSSADEEQEIDADLAWLESLAVRQGADEETLLTRPEERSETPPEWVRDEIEVAESIEPVADVIEESSISETVVGTVGIFAVENEIASAGDATEFQPEEVYEEQRDFTQELPTAQSEDQPVSTPALEEAAVSEMDEEDAFAWLEALAARQGADEGTLITAPEERADTPPEWVYEETGQPAEAAETVEPSPTPLSEERVPLENEIEEVEALPNWFEEMRTGVPEVEPAAEEPSEPAEPTDWFQELQADKPVAETPAALDMDEVVQPEPPALEEEALPDWFTQTEPEAASPAVEELNEETAEVWTQPVDETAEAAPEVEPIAAEAETGFEALDEEPEEEAATQPVSTQELEEVLPAVGAQEPLVEEAAAIDLSMETASEPEAEPEVEPEVEAFEPASGRTAAYTLLESGQVEAAVDRYTELVESGEQLDQVIADLRQALDRYPVDISIWQTLGDAYLRNNQIQEALNSYTKAEELLR